MKVNLLVALILAVAIIAVATGAALAGHGPGVGFGRPPAFGPGPGPELGGFDGRMAKILKLTGTQQAQIKALLDEELEQVKPLFDKMYESRKQLLLAADAAVFDEASVRTIAGEQAKIEIELVVSRTRVQSLINALLTAEQLDLLKNLRPDGR